MYVELFINLESSLFESLIFFFFFFWGLFLCFLTEAMSVLQATVQYLLGLQCFRVLFLICTRWQSSFSCPYRSDFFSSYISWKPRELLPPTDAFQYLLAVSTWTVYCLGTSSLCKQDLATFHTGSNLEVERTKY